MRTLRLIGAPTDAGAGTAGARLGPEALRMAGLAAALQQQGWRVADGGDLTGPRNLRYPPQLASAALQEVVAWNRLLFQAVQEALSWGHVPLVLGGDHSLAIGSIAAVAEHCQRQGLKLRVLWLDAHPDCNTPETTPSGHLHGMPLACLLGAGPARLTHLSAMRPAVRPDQVRLLGVRSVDPGEEVFLASQGLEVVRMPWVQAHGMAAALDKVLVGVDAQTHLHLSLDLDALDPQWAPGVSTPVPGGLDLTHMRRCMQRLCLSGRVGSVDLVELNPLHDLQSRTARLAVELMAWLWAQDAQKTQSSPAVMVR